MEGGPLLTEAFHQFSKDYVMLMHITTKIDRRKHDGLLTKVGGSGFPSFFMLDAAGNVLAQHEGPRNAQAFAKTASNARSFLDLKTRSEAKPDDSAARFEYTMARARLGQLTRPELEAEVQKCGRLSDANRRAYEGVLANLMMEEIRRTAVGERCLEMEQRGLVPADESARAYFYRSIFTAALYKKDRKTADRALGAVRQLWSNQRRYAQTLTRMEAQLAELK